MIGYGTFFQKVFSTILRVSKESDNRCVVSYKRWQGLYRAAQLPSSFPTSQGTQHNEASDLRIS
jgi:hypothetical protein